MRISANFLGWITIGVAAGVVNIILLSLLMDQEVELLRVWLLSPLTALLGSSNEKLLNHWLHVDLTAADGKGYRDFIVKTTEDNARWLSSILRARSEEAKELIGFGIIDECLNTIDEAREEGNEIQLRCAKSPKSPSRM